MKFSKSGPSQKPMLKRFGLKAMIYFLPLSDFLKLYSHFRLYIFFWTGLLFKAESPRVQLHNGIIPVLGAVVSTALVTMVGKRHSIRILHPHPFPTPVRAMMT